MRPLPLWLCATAVVLRAGTAHAQTAAEPLPRFVADVQGVSAGLPSAAGWTPPVPSGTVVPTRGLGVQGGAHVYFGRWGVGSTFLYAKGETTPFEGTPVVATAVRAMTPQFSMNFGHRMGWSYVSTGYGMAQITSEAAAIGTVPASTTDSGWTPAVSFGGGARWFLRERLGVGFDLRWHRLPAREVAGGSAPSQMLFVLGVGVSFQ